MTEVIWETTVEVARNEPGGTIGRVVQAVARGRAGPLFPPLETVIDEDGTTQDSEPAGEAAAGFVAAVLRMERFRPLRDTFETVAAWCERMAALYRDTVAHGVLSPDNGHLFGPLVVEAFTACAADALPDVAKHVATRRHQYLRSLELFLYRFSRDAVAGWPADRRFTGTVVHLSVPDGHSHNGGQRLIRVRLDGGGVIAYRPQPVHGPDRFLAVAEPEEPPASVFDMLNRLPAASGPVRLPTVRSWVGGGDDADCYSWHEWLGGGPSPATAVTGPGYWRRAGALTAACGALGITGWTSERPGGRHGRYQCMSMGLEHVLRAEAGEVYRMVTAAGWEHGAGPTGAPVRLRRAGTRWWLIRVPGRMRPLRGPGDIDRHRQLPDFLTGMFDAWTLICREHDRIADFLADGPVLLSRVSLRPDVEYRQVLWHRITTGAEPPNWSPHPAEREQLERGDVPYFVAEPGDPDLWALWAPPRSSGRIKVSPTIALAGSGGMPSQPRLQRLVRLGELLRDAVVAAKQPAARAGHVLAGMETLPELSFDRAAT
ncbi:uncharacterized protein DUF4135 [Stackebrandtia albiflava]|uniref:Uncharacterized protein DUF4135 n=1 Tax=Stackebrandtia albiflava TaxID=406432 RepID=A0A562V3Z3_9ACTN|nr:DUF4135 domain-containing protein [Stackebrandtia albiflava]TWJ12537.1 uncharacterized protein DUF4135 [Stackebrandtia albiflava]